jgi:hypothetical protein
VFFNLLLGHQQKIGAQVLQLINCRHANDGERLLVSFDAVCFVSRKWRQEKGAHKKIQRKNFQDKDSGNGFSRVKVQATIALSSLINTKKFSTDKFLRKALATIIRFPYFFVCTAARPSKLLKTAMRKRTLTWQALFFPAEWRNWPLTCTRFCATLAR